MTVFLDSTVLVNFAHLDWYPYLSKSVGEEARWVPTVEGECRHLEIQYPGIFKQAKDLLEDPYPKQASEKIKQEARALRQELSKRGGAKGSHGGEAETIAVINQLKGNFVAPVIFVTDDEDARDIAKANRILVWNSWSLVKTIWKQNLLRDIWHARVACETLKRIGCPVPLEVGHPSPDNITRWLAEA